MAYVTMGDLAQTYQSRRSNVGLKTTLLRLSQELSSGQRSDTSTQTSGDFLPVVGLERSLKTAVAYATTANEAALFASAMQSSLDTVQSTSSELSSALLVAGTSENSVMIDTTTVDARMKFGTVLSAFNARVADRYAFSGNATDRPTFADADTILTDLETAISGETTAAGVEAVVNAWFDDVAGGFETIAYTGSLSKLAPIRLAEGESVDLTMTGADSDVREVLKGFALASLVGSGGLAGDSAERAALARRAGEKLLTTQSNLSVMRAEIGSAEARIDVVSANAAARTSALELAKLELTSIDPYKAATELEAVRTQLETLYTITARLSRLSLADYLR